MRLTLPLAIAVCALTARPAFADAPGADWISAGKVHQILQKKGYLVTKVEADDGHWEGDATRKGVSYEFHVDPHSGAVTRLQRSRD